MINNKKIYIYIYISCFYVANPAVFRKEHCSFWSVTTFTSATRLCQLLWKMLSPFPLWLAISTCITCYNSMPSTVEKTKY